MEKKSVNSILQAHLRHTLHQIQELEKEGVNLTVHGECSQRLQKVKAAYQQLADACFAGIQWEDPG